jgi:hypothetical protein
MTPKRPPSAATCAAVLAALKSAPEALHCAAVARLARLSDTATLRALKTLRERGDVVSQLVTVRSRKSGPLKSWYGFARSVTVWSVSEGEAR